MFSEKPIRYGIVNAWTTVIEKHTMSHTSFIIESGCNNRFLFFLDKA